MTNEKEGKVTSSDGNHEARRLHHHPAWVRRNHHAGKRRMEHARFHRIRGYGHRGGRDMRTVG